MSDPIDDLDRLADELETLSRGVIRAPGAGLEWLLRLMADRQASDLLLVAGEPPAFRIDGHVVRLEAASLDGDDIENLVLPELVGHAQRAYR